MVSSVQEMLGVSRAVDRLEERIKEYRNFLIEMSIDNHPEGDINEIAISTGEVETVEALILALAERVTGAAPDQVVWEPMHSYCSKNEEKGKKGWAQQNSEYFRWALLWVQKTRTYIDYLGGIQDAGGAPNTNSLQSNTGSDDIPIYDVALSFAGEDREHARKLAELIRDKDFSVFYDEYEQATLWGRNLYTHLSDIYQNKAKFCLMIVSSNYARKLWTKRERESAQARAFQDSQEYILPLRLDDTEIPGLEKTVGFIDLRSTPYDEVVRLLEEKLNRV